MNPLQKIRSCPYCQAALISWTLATAAVLLVNPLFVLAGYPLQVVLYRRLMTQQLKAHGSVAHAERLHLYASREAQEEHTRFFREYLSRETEDIDGLCFDSEKKAPSSK